MGRRRRLYGRLQERLERFLAVYAHLKKWRRLARGSSRRSQLLAYRRQPAVRGFEQACRRRDHRSCSCRFDVILGDHRYGFVSCHVVSLSLLEELPHPLQYYLLGPRQAEMDSVAAYGVGRATSDLHNRPVAVLSRTPPSPVDEILVVLTRERVGPHSVGYAAILGFTVTTVVALFVLFVKILHYTYVIHNRLRRVTLYTVAYIIWALPQGGKFSSLA